MRSTPPTLHVMCGLPCSGKTTLAKRLERDLNALRLTPDEWIARILPENWNRAELDRLRDPTECVQWEVAERALTLGIDVILDWGLWSRRERDDLRDRARRLGAAFRIHYCEASLPELLSRLRVRNLNLRAGEFENTESEIEAYAAQFEPPSGDELDSAG